MAENDIVFKPPSFGRGLEYWLQVAVGIVFTVAGIVFIIEAQQFRPMRAGTQIGPGLLPTICGFAFIVLGPALVTSTIFQKHRIGGNEELDLGSFRFIASIIIGMIGVIYLMPYLGFILTCALYSWIVTWVAGAKWWGAVISAVLISGSVYYLFTEFLRVVLPPGIIF